MTQTAQTHTDIEWMFWFEEIKQNGLVEALRRAAEYYHKKYGAWPNHVLCPKAWGDEAKTLQEQWVRQGKNGPKIEIASNILARHLWLRHDPQEKN